MGSQFDKGDQKESQSDAANAVDSQANFVEAREPAELIMCVILAACYLGLAKICWQPLIVSKSWKLLINVEGFLITISLLAILVGIRPYFSPSSLQISSKGVKYRGPYWPRRKSVNWEQVLRLYVSPELIIILYKPNPKRKRTWPLVIPSIYLADRNKIPSAVTQFSPIEPIVMSSPALVSRIAFGLLFIVIVIWLLEMLIG
jgi:hypothetical protein